MSTTKSRMNSMSCPARLRKRDTSELTCMRDMLDTTLLESNVAINERQSGTPINNRVLLMSKGEEESFNGSWPMRVSKRRTSATAAMNLWEVSEALNAAAATPFDDEVDTSELEALVSGEVGFVIEAQGSSSTEDPMEDSCRKAMEMLDDICNQEDYLNDQDELLDPDELLAFLTSQNDTSHEWQLPESVCNISSNWQLPTVQKIDDRLSLMSSAVHSEDHLNSLLKEHCPSSPSPTSISATFDFSHDSPNTSGNVTPDSTSLTPLIKPFTIEPEVFDSPPRCLTLENFVAGAPSNVGESLNKHSSSSFHMQPLSNMSHTSGRNGAERKEWTAAEDATIQSSVQLYGCKWRKIAALLPGRSDDAVRNRWNRLRDSSGDQVQPTISRRSSSTDSSSKPERVSWTKVEDATILGGVQELGHKWNKIAERLPGRTDHAIRNRFHRLQSMMQDKQRTQQLKLAPEIPLPVA